MKKLFLFTLICSLGFFTACSDDDDNDTPTPTPPEVNLAKEIEGLYDADLFLTYESAQDTSDQTINFFPQGKDYVKLKTSNINYKIGKNTIGSIEIDSIPVANSFSKAADHNIYFKITNKKVILSKLGEMTANGNGSIGGGAIQFQLKLQNTDLTVDLNFKGRQTMNDQPEILKMTFDNDMVLSQPEIKYENYKYEIVFYVKPDADLSKLQLTPIIELSKGAIVKPVSGEVVDFSKAIDQGDNTEFVYFNVVSENYQKTRQYRARFKIGQSVPKATFENWVSEGNDFYKPEGQWATSNKGISLIKIFPGLYDGGAIVAPVTEGQSGKAAKISTAYTTGKESILGFPPIPVITSGSLFLGDFEVDTKNTLNSTQFGIPYFQKPIRVKGYYKYKPGEKYYYCKDPKNNSNKAELDPEKTDQGALSAVLYEVDNYTEFLNGETIFNSDKIVAIAQLITGQQDSFKEFDLTLDYKQQYNPAKKYRFAVIFSSSKDGDKFCGAGGSELIVDEVEVINE